MKSRILMIAALALSAIFLTVSCAPGHGYRDLWVQDTDPVTITVTTTFAGEDEDGRIYRNAVHEWEKESGYKVRDNSTSSDETFKMRVTTAFEAGDEPDVLFFFNGADADEFIKAGKVVSIDEIRKDYPEYASNMNDSLIGKSPADGVRYAIPIRGYWEALYCNMEVLEAAGVEKPGPDTDWNEFLEDCKKIKAAGYIPIAAALGNIPHYWWEYMIFNHQSPESHLVIPSSNVDGIGLQWQAGITDIKTLYERGYFPANTLYATDDETFAMFMDSQAAFLVDGSWKLGSIVQACTVNEADESTLDTERLDNFDVTYFPGNGGRKSTDLIGGFSMGYYITRKAYEDPGKQAAAVSFVEYMTSTKNAVLFAQHTATALKEVPDSDMQQYNSLQLKAMNMMTGVTSFTGAVQDLYNGECRVSTFNEMPSLVTGRKDISKAIQEGLDIYHESE
ncbi:ABC transporter substrate-binding protein [Butyrivibrio sp. MC2013]|uniref:ABC transporter substrate-binding protein n=1 Tax=Butyrivibrio sp. MC2013 TaxID=1280686 RepID=UPI00040D9C1D|nr:extracellular solute-binding protein [Butyrivibrio sp. MC2013]